MVRFTILFARVTFGLVVCFWIAVAAFRVEAARSTGGGIPGGLGIWEAFGPLLLVAVGGTLACVLAGFASRKDAEMVTKLAPAFRWFAAALIALVVGYFISGLPVFSLRL
jgi:hypothetical protein